MKYLIFIAFITANSLLFGQSTLPTSFDFATTPTTLPTGWSTNTTANYTSGLNDNSGGTSRAGKLQATDHYFLIEFFDEPAQVSYYIKSYGTASFMGTFEVQESTNGASWSTLHAFGNSSFNDQWTQYTDIASTNSRYIRFILTNKVSGTNVGLDNVSITEYIPTYAEINIKYEGENVPHTTGIQFSSNLSVALPIKLAVENLGTQDTLAIGSISFSGSAASDYSLVSAPNFVEPSAIDTITLNFTPSANGSRLAIVSIMNNDQNENPYQIQLNGIEGSGATEPSSNPLSLINDILKTYRIIAHFTPVDADGYLVLYRLNAPFVDEPQDGTAYTKGQGIGTAKVAYAGSNSTFHIREGRANTKYYVKVFAFNGSGNFINYRTSDPLFDSLQTPLASMVDENYYSQINSDNPNFLNDLTDLINPHYVRYYSNYGPDFVRPFLSRDTANGQEVMTGVYSGLNITYYPPFDWTSTNMNREHTFPASWMPSYGTTTTPEYQDLHHLMPTVAQANNQRSNHPLGKVVNVTNSFGSGKLGSDASGNTVYEPRDAQKGDAARAIFYMQTTYNSSSESWAIPDLGTEGPSQKITTLVDWHLHDLPSAFEHARNDFVDSLQNNRNPYIDSAQWVCYIDFYDLQYKLTPDSACLELAGVNNQPDTTDTANFIIGLRDQINWLFYPNPTSDFFYVANDVAGHFEVVIANIHGELAGHYNATSELMIDLRDLPDGIYTASLISKNETQTVRLIKSGH